MDYFFNPREIALIGATPKPLKTGHLVLRNLMNSFKGIIYPVNRNYTEIEGLPCFGSVNDIPGNVDLAILVVPAESVQAHIEECIEKRILGAIIESGGFAETGPAGRKLQDRLAALGRKGGIRLWGPNCVGLVNGTKQCAFTFFNPDVIKKGVIPGDISLIVQSGFIAGGLLTDIMSNGVMGISKVCSIGNKIDVNECDLLSYFMNDTDTGLIGLYLESYSDGRLFANLCRKSTKPIVVLKGGKSKKGAEAAISHTASLAGNQQISSNILAQLGVTEAHDFKQMMDFCRTLPRKRKKEEGSPGRIAVLSSSGGTGIVSADFIEEKKLIAVDLAEDTKQALKTYFPDWMPVSNPVDIWPAIEKTAALSIDLYTELLNILLSDAKIDGVLVLGIGGNTRININLEAWAGQSRLHQKPIFIWMLGSREQTYEMQTKARTLEGIYIYNELFRAVECMAEFFRSRPMNMTIEPVRPCLELDRTSESAPKGILDEYESKRILKQAGIPVVEEAIVSNRAECINAIKRIGFPLVMKGLSPGMVHKTEHGLVHLGIENKAAALKTHKKFSEKMSGTGKILIQKQIRSSVELILGFLRDPQFGPCVMLGAGGVMADIIDDAVFAMAPLTFEEAINLIGRLRSQKLLDGFRGSPPVSREKLANILIRLGFLGSSDQRIREIDINPLLVSDADLVAVDSTILLS